MTADFGGIDFGTSNSTAGLIRGGKPQLVKLEGDQTTIPSAVFFNFETDRTAFGRQAIAEYTANSEGRLLRALKSVLGTSLIREKTRIKAHSIAFTDIIGGFLASIKDTLEAEAGGPVDKVVLGRPVHFVDGDETADREAQDALEKAARSRGFRHVSFQFEPIAAALDYEQQVRGEELAVIADIGGGTSDFSIVRVSPQRALAADRRDDILASSGVHIGGTDFDRLLSMASVMPELGHGTATKDGKRNLPVGYYFDLATWQRINLLYTAKAMTDLRQIRYEAARPDLVERMIEIVRHRQGHALAGKVEQAKIALTDEPVAMLKLDMLDEPLDIAIAAQHLARTIEAPVRRIAETIDAVLRDAGVPARRIDTVFLTGGSTALPQVREAITASFDGARIVTGDRFGSVGLGLTLEAARRFR